MTMDVSASGASIETATGPSQLLSMKNPFTKLDTTNQVSFQTIQLLLNHEPPQAPATSPFYTNTLVYQFKHGYSYIPAVWMEWQNNSPAFPAAPASGSTATTFFPTGDDAAGKAAYLTSTGTLTEGDSLVAQVQYNSSGTLFNATDGSLFLTADATYVYLYVQKLTLLTIGGAIKPLFLIGTILNIRIYVFVEPATTSTY